MSTVPVESTSIFNPNLFEGKVIFATGGGSGIGYAQVLGMMKHGCNAAIFGRRKEVIEASAAKLSSQTNRTCIGLQGDVRSPESLVEAVKACVEKFGKIDFVLCAAAGNFLTTLDGISPNGFKTVVEIDLLGTFNTVKATIQEVKKTKGVYLADSMTLHFVGTPYVGHASAAKAGIDSLIRTMAVEYGPLGIRANTLHPGGVDSTEGKGRLILQEKEKDVVRAIPIQRLGTLDDCANATIFLFSNAAANITGAHIVCDGGTWLNQDPNSQGPYPKTLVDKPRL